MKTTIHLAAAALALVAGAAYRAYGDKIGDAFRAGAALK